MKAFRSLLGLSLLSLPFLGFGAVGDVEVEITDEKGAPVADAVASLRALDAPPAEHPAADAVLVIQQEQGGIPHVTAVAVGTQVSFPVFHPAHQPVLFDRPGVIALTDQARDLTAAYLVVLPTPFFATTGPNGIAPLAALPSGRYLLEVWHPQITAVVRRDVIVNLDTSRPQVIAVTLHPDERIRQPPPVGGVG